MLLLLLCLLPPRQSGAAKILAWEAMPVPILSYNVKGGYQGTNNPERREMKEASVSHCCIHLSGCLQQKISPTEYGAGHGDTHLWLQPLGGETG